MSKFLKKPWHKISITTGIQICEGNRVIVYIGEPDSKDYGPHRTQDVIERVNILFAAPDLLEACEFALTTLCLGYDAEDGEAANKLRAAIAKAKNGT